jgi:hypothetical protein
MPIDRKEAAASLSDVALVEQRTFTAVFYGIGSRIFLLWGVLTAAGYLWCQYFPEHAGRAWGMLDGLGTVAMIALLHRRSRRMMPGQRALGQRLVGALLLLFLFGGLILGLLGPFDGRRIDALWPLIFALGFGLMGLWVGRFFLLCGAVLAALTVVGFLWSGPWFSLWMAVANGGALLLGSLWLRRAGAVL